MRMKELKAPALRRNDIPALVGGPLRTASVAEVRLELLTIFRTLNIPRNDDAELTVDEDEWQLIMSDFLDRLQPPSGTGEHRTDPVDRSWVEPLQYRFGQVMRALKEADRIVDTHGAPTALLLPDALSDRIGLLLGVGVLPMAWVRALDVVRH